MTNEKTLLLSGKQVEQRLNRLAYQIYEDNSKESEIIIAGIQKNGFKLAGHLAELLKKISSLKIILAEVNINKHSQYSNVVSVSLSKEELHDKSIVLVDDVLNSGKTLLYSLRPFLDADIRKIRTAVLVDRNHKSYPIAADFVGQTLSNTLLGHLDVEFNGEKGEAWLK